MMDLCLWDLLWIFCFQHYPPLLDDEPAFKNLHDLIHLLLQKEQQRQLARTHQRIGEVTRVNVN